jgi:hypothetical protein
MTVVSTVFVTMGTGWPSVPYCKTGKELRDRLNRVGMKRRT